MSYRYRFLVLFLLLIFNLIGAKNPAAAEGFSIVERAEEEEIIIAVEANGYLRNEGILGYLPSEGSLNNLLIPLSEFAKIVNYAITVNPGDGMAEGFFLEPTNLFQLDIARREVLVKSSKYSFQKKEVEAHIDDIYVMTSALSRWFGLEVQFQPSTLILEINSDQKFPFEAQIDRSKRAKSALKTVSSSIIDPEKAFLIPYSFYSNPTFIFQQSANVVSTDDDTIFQNNGNVQGGLDLLGFGANFNASYLLDNQNPSEITQARLTLARSDPRRELLGPLKAGRVEIGDVNFPPIPLFLGNQRGSGVSVSSDPELGFKISQQFSGFLIDGDAPVDWDAELYRNGQFIAFQTIGADGRFSFEDVDLINGFNRFQIVLFGPEGQKETITRNVFSGPSILDEGDFQYNFALGRPQAGFLPFAEQVADNNTFGAAFEAFYGITKNLTIGGALYTGPEDEENDTTSASFSVSSSLGGISSQLQGFFAEDGRNAYQGAVRATPLGVATALTHTQFNNFEDDEQQLLESTTELSFAKNFSYFNLNLSGERQTFFELADQDIVEALVSTNFYGINLSNTLTRTFSDSESLDDFDGLLNLVGNIFDTRIRTSLSYNFDEDTEGTFQNLQFSTQNSLPYNASLRFLGDYNFLNEQFNASARYSKQFEKFTLDLDLAGSTESVFSVGFTLRFGLQPDLENRYRFVNPRNASLARLGVRAFVDENGNDVFDAEEELIEKVRFNVNKSNTSGLTNEQGVAELENLVQAPTRISINQAQIPSINLVPSRENIDVIPRTGSQAVIDFAFTKLGEIDGFVLNENGEAVSGVPVIIRNLSTGEEIRDYETEYDGYFVFSSLPLDDYEIVTGYDWIAQGEDGEASTNVTLTQDDPLLYDVQLELPVEEIPAELLADDSVLIAQAEAKVEDNAADTRFKGLRYPPGFVVQLGSYKILDNANRKVRMLKSNFEKQLSDIDLFIFEKEVYPTDFYNRIYTQSMSFSFANILCQDLKTNGLRSGCLTVNYP